MILKFSRLFALCAALTLLGESVVAAGPAFAGPRHDESVAVPSADATPAPGASPAPPGPPYHAASPEYGTVVHVYGQPTLDRDLALAQAAGFKWITVEMPWANMEP